MSGIDCYVDAQGCVVCPELSAVERVPAQVEQRSVVGWNAGGNSIATVDGNLHAVFSMPSVTGVVIGLKGSRARQTVPDGVEHGIYFQRAGGIDVFRLIERGAPVTSTTTRSVDDTFEIRRIKGVITYLRNGTVIHTSELVSKGAKVLNACLYASGDELFGGASNTGGDETDGQGNVKLVSGAAVAVTFVGPSTDYTTDPGWFIDVPAGMTSLVIQLTVPVGNPSDVYMAVNPTTRPSGTYDSADTGSWYGISYAGAAGNEPNAAPTDFLFEIADPTAARWYIVLDAVAAGSGYALQATVS